LHVLILVGELVQWDISVGCAISLLD